MAGRLAARSRCSRPSDRTISSRWSWRSCSRKCLSLAVLSGDRTLPVCSRFDFDSSRTVFWVNAKQRKLLSGLSNWSRKDHKSHSISCTYVWVCLFVICTKRISARSVGDHQKQTGEEQKFDHFDGLEESRPGKLRAMRSRSCSDRSKTILHDVRTMLDRVL